KVPFVVRARRPWLGLPTTHGVDLTIKAGSQQKLASVRLVVTPILPRWVQAIFSKLYSMFSPIAIPVLSVALLVGVGYFLLRPPEIKEFRSDPGSIVAGQETQLLWTTDRAAGVSIDPPVGDKLPTDGQQAVSPQAKTEYKIGRASCRERVESQVVAE